MWWIRSWRHPRSVCYWTAGGCFCILLPQPAYAQNRLHTFSRNFPIDGEVANLLATSRCNGIWETTRHNRHNRQDNLLRTCYWETASVMGFGIMQQQQQQRAVGGRKITSWLLSWMYDCSLHQKTDSVGWWTVNVYPKNNAAKFHHYPVWNEVFLNQNSQNICRDRPMCLTLKMYENVLLSAEPDVWIAGGRKLRIQKG